MLVFGDQRFRAKLVDSPAEYHDIAKRFAEDLFGSGSLFFDRAALAAAAVPAAVGDCVAVDLESWHWYLVCPGVPADRVWSHLAPSITEKLVASGQETAKHAMAEAVVDAYKSSPAVQRQFREQRIDTVDAHSVAEQILHGAPVVAVITDRVSRPLQDLVRVLKVHVRIVEVRKYADPARPRQFVYEIPDERLPFQEEPPPSVQEILAAPVRRPPGIPKEPPRPEFPPIPQPSRPEPPQRAEPPPIPPEALFRLEPPAAPPEPPQEPAAVPPADTVGLPPPDALPSLHPGAEPPAPSNVVPSPEPLQPSPASLRRLDRVRAIRTLIDQSPDARAAYDADQAGSSVSLVGLLDADLLAEGETLTKTHRLRNGQTRRSRGVVNRTGAFSVQDMLLEPGEPGHSDPEAPGWITSDGLALRELKRLLIAERAAQPPP